jgi:hypothetical protein
MKCYPEQVNSTLIFTTPLCLRPNGYLYLLRFQFNVKMILHDLSAFATWMWARACDCFLRTLFFVESLSHLHIYVPRKFESYTKGTLVSDMLCFVCHWFDCVTCVFCEWIVALNKELRHFVLCNYYTHVECAPWINFKSYMGFIWLYGACQLLSRDLLICVNYMLWEYWHWLTWKMCIVKMNLDDLRKNVNLSHVIAVDVPMSKVMC